MALQKQIVSIDLGFGGIDQKTDSKRVIPTRLVRAENVRYRKTGSLTKQLGYVQYDAASSITFGRLIASENNIIGIHEAIRAVYFHVNDGTTYGIFQPVSVGTQLGNKPGLPKVEYESVALPGDRTWTTTQIDYVTGVDGSDYALFFYRVGGTLNRFVSPIDTNDNLSLTTMSAPSNASVQVARLNASASRNAFAYVVSGSAAVTISKYDVNAADVTNIQLTTATAGTKFDMCVVGNNVFVAYQGAITTSVYISKWNVGTNALSTTAMAMGGVVSSVAISPRNSGIFYAASTTAVIKAGSLDTNLAQTLALATITTATTAVDRMTIATSPEETTPGNDPYFSVVWQENGSTTLTNGVVSSAFISGAGGSLVYNTGTETARPALLASKANWSSSLNLHCVLNFDTTIQRTLLVASGSYYSSPGIFRAYGAALHQQALPSPQRSGVTCLPNINYNSTTNVLRIPTGKLVQARSFNSSYTYIYEVGRLNAYLSVTHIGEIRSDGLKMDGGIMLSSDDSTELQEAAFKFYPEIRTINGAYTTSGNKALTGTYSVSGYFYSYGAGGKVIAGPLAPPRTVTLSGTQNSIAVDFTNNSITIGGGQRLAVVCTGNAGTIYYNEANTSTSAGAQVTSTSFSLTASDSTLIASSPAYITGGVLENWAPSCPITIASNGRRMIAVPGDDPNFVMISKEKRTGEGYAFMEDIGRRITNGGSKIIVVKALGDKWIAFKERAIFAASGEGPDDTGQNDTLSEFEPISTDIGCINKRACVTTRYGIFFVSKKGIYLLDQGLNLTYVGAGVEDTNPTTIISASYVEDQGIVYFLTSSNTLLELTIYETESANEFRWATNPATTWSDIASLNGRLYAAPTTITADFSVIRQRGETDATPYLNQSGTGYSYVIETAWIPMGSIQGFGRLYEVLLVGTASDSNWNAYVEIGYDYETNWSSSLAITATNAQLGSTNAQWRVQPPRQKCEAARFRVTVTDPNNSGTKGLELSQLQMVVGIKGTANKMRAGKQAT